MKEVVNLVLPRAQEDRQETTGAGAEVRRKPNRRGGSGNYSDEYDA